MQKVEPLLLLLIAVLLALPATRPAMAEGNAIFGLVGKDGAVELTDHPADGLRTIIALGNGTPVAPQPVAPQPVVAVPAKGPFARIINDASRIARVPPQLLQAVITVESGFNPQAVSRKGARGLMQLMPATARRFAARNLFDPRDNVLAGAKYLHWLLTRFKGNVELALAGYNAGENAVIHAGYRIPALAETQSYVPMVMAHYRRLLSGRS